MIVRIQIPESHLQSLAVPSTETDRSELLSIDQSMSLSDGDVKLTDKQTNRQTDKHTSRQADKQTNRQTDKQTNRQTDKQTNRQIEKQTN